VLCHLCPALVPSLRRPDHPSYGSWSSRDLQDLGPYHDIIPSNALVHLVVLHCYDVCLGVCAACCPAYVRCAMHVCACPATPCSSSRPRTDVDQYHHLVDPDPRGLVISWYWLSSPPALPLSTHCVCSCVACVCGVSALLRTAMARGAMLASTVRQWSYSRSCGSSRGDLHVFCITILVNRDMVPLRDHATLRSAGTRSGRA